MDAVLHFPYWGAKPDGIWWFDGSPTLGSYYADNVPLSMLGGYTMSAYRHRADEFDTPGFFTRLAERWPSPDVWETVTLTGIDAKSYLDMVRGFKATAA